MTYQPEDKGRLKNKLNEWKLELWKSLIYKEGEERSSQRKPRRKRSERLGDETGKGDAQKKRE